MVVVNKRQVFHGVLDIPEGKVGKFEVRHMHEPAGKTFQLANGRTAILGGDRRGSVTFVEPTRWHELLEAGRRWMSDWPIEQAQHDRELHPMRGSVLVGGLGLGYAATVLASKRSVSRVVVVEKAAEVIALVAPHLLRGKPSRGKLEFVQADLFHYLKTTTERFSWGFYDIWASDSENTFFETVCPLRQLSDGKVRQLVCWNENVMRGQLMFSLQGRLAGLDHPEWWGTRTPVTLDMLCAPHPKGSIWHDWTVPFFRWVRDRKPKGKVLEQGVAMYATRYGAFPGWETGWEMWQRIWEKSGGQR